MLVFISYSRQDSTKVELLANDLRKYQIPIWLDIQDIPAGSRWDIAIEEALSRASHVLFVMSMTSTQSENVRDELDYAIDAGKVVIPVRIEDCSPPLRVRRMQYIDLETNYDAGLNRLIMQLGFLNTNSISADDQKKETLRQKGELLYDLNGMWIDATENRTRVMFLKQIGRIVRGFYDYGTGKKIGIYFGFLDGNVFTYTWTWLDESYSGSGRMVFETDKKQLTQYWWGDTAPENPAHRGIYTFISTERPNWLDEEDFEKHDNLFNL